MDNKIIALQGERVLFQNIKGIERKYWISIVASILIAIISLGFILWNNTNEQAAKYIAEEGKLDLTSWDLYGKENIELLGKWEFYPGKLMDFPNPAKDVNEIKDDKSVRNYVEVPGEWNSYLNDNGSPDGSGTYRLVIKVPKEGTYGIKTGTIRAACRIFLNGEEVASMGNPSLDKSDFVPLSKYNIGFTQSINQEIHLAIQVSNYDYRAGGILKPIKFGTFDSVIDHMNRQRAIEALLIATCLIIGITFLFIYIQRGQEPYLAYFSAANIIMAIYLSTMNNQLLNLLFDYSFIGRIRIQILAIIVVTLCFLQFAHHFFRSYSNNKVVHRLNVMMLGMLIFVVNNPLKTPSFRIEFGQTMLSIAGVISYGYIFWVLIKAMMKKASLLEYILPISTSVFSYWLAMFSKILFEVELGYLPAFLILLIMMGTTLLISNRLHLEYIEATELTEERLEKEFQYFYSQISPHFLYNTLNTIIALSYRDAEKTRNALNNLSVYFRGKLELHLQKGLIPLERELDMVIAYLEIEQMRYEEKLRVKYDIEEGLIGMMPPLSLQPLVENAVRHGIKPKEEGGIVRISARREAEDLIGITIEDDGVGMPPEKQVQLLDEDSERLGFKNVIKKIKLLDGASFELKSELNKGTSIKILIPEVKDHESNYS